MKKALALILALALSLSLFGCSPAEAPEDSPNAGGDGTQASAGAFVGNESDEYYMVSFLSGIDYWKHCFEGMEDAGNALGVTTKYTGQTDSDVAGQVAVLEQVIAQSPKGIAVTCVNSTALADTINSAKEQGISHEEMHSEVEYIVAHGIASRVGGTRVVIGSAHFIFEDEGCTIPAEEQAKFDALDPQYSHLYLAASGVLAGVICIADPLRPEAAQVLYKLRKLGIAQTVMMTGDSDRTARAIAAQVGVDRCFAEVLPEDKAAFVRDAKAEGHTVVMIGDGINDSPALSAADIGIAIHSGAAIAREIADVTIRADSLEELVTLKAIANALQKRVGSNYRFVLSFNSALILLGALGILPPATSAMLHNLSTLGISLRSMTDLLEQKLPCKNGTPERPQMLRRTEMIALPIKRKLLHKCCVICTPNTGHPVLGVYI